MRKNKTPVHFTFMPGEIASEVCGNAQCDDRMTAMLFHTTCKACLDRVENLARNASIKRRKVDGVACQRKTLIDFMGWLMEQHLRDCVEDINPERAADEFLEIDRKET